MTTDIHAAFEAKYKASAQDPACAEELRVFSDGWNAARAAITGSSQAAFEATVSQVGEFYFEKDAAGEYINSYARTAWIVWQARDAEIAALESKLRATEATLFEYRKLINERPAVNAGLLSEYQRWTGKVYSLEIINAVDVAIDQARTDGRS